MFATAIVESLRRYSASQLRSDVSAGITVGVVAIPLSMALAIASGVPPQHGLYTAIIAGAIVALCGGSRVNISGPTAAFVVVLLPVVHQFGLGGLVLAGLMSGLILIALGVARMGRLIEFVPYPVTVGFTAGIAVVIAVLQIKDFAGLTIAEPGDNFVARVWAIGAALPTLRWQDTLVGVMTLTLLIAWPRLQERMPVRVPGPLAVLALVTLVAWLATLIMPGFSLATIGSTFSYSLDGILHDGIPALPPMLIAPWELPGPDGAPIGLSFGLIHDLLGPAITIAALAAIESLLCAVIADGMAGTRHNPNAELIGLGIGNVVVPFFAGIPATAAISRTATSIRAGARSPIAAIVHAGVVLLAVLAIASLLNQVPMAALAALLLTVAWNMSEMRHVLRIVRTAPGSDIAVLMCCFSLTVLFDMTVAVAVGIGLAAMLFIRQVIEQTGVRALTSGGRTRRRRQREQLPEGVVVYDIDGALFFGAAHRALRALEVLPPNARVVVLDMDDVSMLDMTAMMLLQELLSHLGSRGAVVIIAGLHPRLILQLRRSGIRRRRGAVEFRSDLSRGLARAAAMVAGSPEPSEEAPGTEEREGMKEEGGDLTDR
ncbi:MAG: C4-dicarboxylic acid transporter DauA [Gammaproteobacteria bacterium]|jgi:SulP family sulfate permease|nr:C4-dicarboxylic acid transporter DauA [Gammaproteobacteria bacterium]